ncbi:MAG: cysteine rich repeat-containing protein [Sulfurifustis sp.]
MQTTRVMIVLLATLTAGAAEAQTSAQAITQKVKEGCQQELDTYCKAVSPGEGRVFACLYAYSDKLSGRCEYALYDASKQLEEAVAMLNHVAEACANDLAQYCSDVSLGEGRVADCMKKNEAKTSAACQQAMKDTGMAAK